MSGSGTGRLVLVPGRDALWFSGGGESYTVAVGRAAILAGFETHVFSLGPSSAVIESDFGVVHRIRAPVSPRSMNSVLYRPLLVPPLVRFLEREPGPHILHGNGAWGDIAVAASRQLRRRGVAAVPVASAFTTAEHEARGKLARATVGDDRALRARLGLELAWVRAVTVPVERHLYRAARAIVVHYESVRSLLERAYGAGLPICRLPYAAPTAFSGDRARPPLPEALRGFGDPTAPLILAISRHDARKGLSVLIEALARLREAGRPFRACLVGTGLLLEAHRRLVGSLGLAGHVLLPGRVPEIAPYLAHADVFALPSLEEGSGSLSVLEALQAGTAIVASAIDGIPEDLVDGDDALLVAPGDAAALGAALGLLLGDPALRAVLGARARSLYDRRFAAGAMTDALAEFYAELGLRARSSPAERWSCH